MPSAEWGWYESQRNIEENGAAHMEENTAVSVAECGPGRAEGKNS
jgi:hypothetical protein